MNTIKGAWAQFSEEVLPANCSDVQRIETENAFYCGAIAMFGMMTGDIADFSEEAAMAAMDGLHDEILAFKKELLAGEGA